MNAGVVALACVIVAGCSTLTPRGALREEFRLSAICSLEQDGAALFGEKPPSLEVLRSGGNSNLILRLVRQLEGPLSVRADTLLESIAVLEGRSIAWSLCDGFETMTNSLAVDDLNVILMKATAVGSVTISFPETGSTVRYRIRLTDTGFGYPLPQITHGICPACYKAAMGGLEN
jgi:hypothetical protein